MMTSLRFRGVGRPGNARGRRLLPVRLFLKSVAAVDLTQAAALRARLNPAVLENHVPAVALRAQHDAPPRSLREAQRPKEQDIFTGGRVRGGQQLFAEEDRVRPGHKA